MQKYELIDGFRLAADHPEAIVNQLQAGSKFATEESAEAFRQGFAQRAKELYRVEIRWDKAENFVQDLLEYNLLKMLE
jgi:hypothetical protein